MRFGAAPAVMQPTTRAAMARESMQPVPAVVPYGRLPRGMKFRHRKSAPVSKVHRLAGLGQWEAFAAQAASAYMQDQQGGAGGGGGGGAAPPGGPQSTSSSAVQATISPTIATQISPQISPSFVQQFQPSGSGVSTGASQGGSPLSMPGSSLPAGNASMFPTLMPSSYLPPAIQTPGVPFDWAAWKWPLIGGAALLVALPLLKRKRAA